MKSIIWRIAAGDEDKDLIPSMLEASVMMIGPGDTGDLHGKSREQIRESIRNTIDDRDRTVDALVRFRDEPQDGQIVVLRLGSVCFAVGVVKGSYKYDRDFRKILGHWNPNGCFNKKEMYWNLSHTRSVLWYIIKDPKAIYHFRKGIYGGPVRFCKVGDGSTKKGSLHPEAGKDARKALDDYLWDLKYNNCMGREILDRIGLRCFGVNEYGFPTPRLRK